MSYGPLMTPNNLDRAVSPSKQIRRLQRKQKAVPLGLAAFSTNIQPRPNYLKPINPLPPKRPPHSETQVLTMKAASNEI